MARFKGTFFHAWLYSLGIKRDSISTQTRASRHCRAGDGLLVMSRTLQGAEDENCCSKNSALHIFYVLWLNNMCGMIYRPLGHIEIFWSTCLPKYRCYIISRLVLRRRNHVLYRTSAAFIKMNLHQPIGTEHFRARIFCNKVSGFVSRDVLSLDIPGTFLRKANAYWDSAESNTDVVFVAVIIKLMGLGEIV